MGLLLKPMRLWQFVKGRCGRPTSFDCCENLQQAMRKHMHIDKLRYLLYPKDLANHDRQTIQKNDAGVVWL